MTSMEQPFPPAIPTEVPTPARMYDYGLGGKDNYAIDRQAALAGLAVFPEILDIARENRLFLYRVVRYLSRDVGIRQFLDMGSGLPAQQNVHQVAQQFRPEPQKRDHLRTNTRLDSPFRPLLRIYFKFHVHEPIPQRCWHTVGRGAIIIPFACRYNRPAIRQGVLPQFAVQDKLVAARLNHRWRRVQLVEEKYACSISRQEIRRRPFRTPIRPEKR